MMALQYSLTCKSLSVHNSASRYCAWIGARVLPYMQSVDRYHIGKHHRKDRPEDFTAQELANSRRKGLLLTLHAWLLRKPYRAVRHFVMGRFMKVNSSAIGMESSHSKSEIPPAKAA